MASDRYMQQQGRIYAANIVQGLGVLLSDPEFLNPTLERLELMCVTHPPAFSKGVSELVQLVRSEHGKAS